MSHVERCIRTGYGECFGDTKLEQIVEFGKKDIMFALEKATEGTKVELKQLQELCEVIKGVTSAQAPHLWLGVNIFSIFLLSHSQKIIPEPTPFLPFNLFNGYSLLCLRILDHVGTDNGCSASVKAWEKVRQTFSFYSNV